MQNNWQDKIFDFAHRWLFRDPVPLTIITGGFAIASNFDFMWLIRLAIEALNGNIESVSPPSTSSQLTIGLVIVVFGVFLKSHIYRHDFYNISTKIRDDKDKRLEIYLTEYDTLIPVIKQMKFRSIFQMHPPVSTIDLLLSHPDKPFTVLIDYCNGGMHVAKDGNWFDWRNKRHRLAEGFVLVAGLITLFFGIVAIIVGPSLLYNPLLIESKEILAYSLILLGLLALITFAMYVNDWSSYAAARRLINSAPNI